MWWRVICKHVHYPNAASALRKLICRKLELLFVVDFFKLALKDNNFIENDKTGDASIVCLSTYTN